MIHSKHEASELCFLKRNEYELADSGVSEHSSNNSIISA